MGERVRRGADNGRFKDGYFAGWQEYRFGGPRKPVTLAHAKPPQTLSPEKREHARSVLRRIMGNWQQSPFEHEAIARAGVRSALCLESWSWGRADHQAEKLVSEVLRVMGAERPSWEEGQRRYVDPEDNCRWCGIPIPEENRSNGRSRIFCSDECGVASHRAIVLDDAHRDEKVFNAAYAAVKRSRAPKRTCKQCGQLFSSENKKAVFCSLVCSSAAQKFEVLPRPCLQCNTVFAPRIDEIEAKFCCISCRRAYGKMTFEVRGTCEWCGISYVCRSRTSKCCSHACATKLSDVRRGKQKRISPPVFDYLFRQAA